MKKVLLSLLAIVLILGVLGAAGYAGYQYGYRQGALASTNGSAQVTPRGDRFNWHAMPMQNFGFDRQFGRGNFHMMGRGIGFGFFSPLLFLARIAFWALVIWAIYMLIVRSGRLTRTPAVVEPVSPAPGEEKNEA